MSGLSSGLGVAFVPAMRAMCGIHRDCRRFCVSLSFFLCSRKTPLRVEMASQAHRGAASALPVSRGCQPGPEQASVCPAETRLAGLSFPGMPGCVPGRQRADPLSWQPQSSRVPAGAGSTPGLLSASWLCFRLPAS